MARITWQNVTAPDFSAAIAGQRTAGDLIGKGTDAISKSLGSLDYRDRSRASAQALNEGLKVQDVTAWDQLLANGGLESLGIAADRATPELLNFIQGRRGSLESDRSTDYDFNRTGVIDERRDVEYQAGQDAAAIDLAANELVQGISQGTKSREEAERAILNQGLDSTLERAALGALGNQPASRWEALPQEFSPEVNEAVTITRDGINARQRELDIQFKSDANLQLWTDGMDRYEGSTNVGESLIKRVSDYAGTQGNDTDKGEFREATGEIQKEFNNLKKQFPDLPDSLIASALESNIEATGFAWVYDKNVTFDTRSAVNQLKSMNSAADRQGLESIRADYVNRKSSLEKDRKRLDKAEQDLALALTRGKSGDKEREALFAIQRGLVNPEAAPADTTSAFGASFRAPSTTNSSVNVTPSDLARAGRDAPLAPAAADPLPQSPTGTDFAPGAGPIAPTIDDAPAPQASPQPAAEAQVIQSAAADPVNTIAAITQQVGLPAEVSQQAQSLVQALSTGTNPETGAPLSEQESVAIQRQLAAVVDAARRSYQPTGPNDPIAELLAQPERWIRF